MPPMEGRCGVGSHGHTFGNAGDRLRDGCLAAALPCQILCVVGEVGVGSPTLRPALLRQA